MSLNKIIITVTMLVLFMTNAVFLFPADTSDVQITLLHYSQRDMENNPQIKLKSQGIPTVPVGQLVYLQAKTEAKQTTGYQWSLESPAGSKASFNEPTAAAPTLVPDLEGQYKIKLRVTTAAGTSSEASLWLTAAAFVGDGLLVKTGSKGQCINCHEEQVKSWKTSHHASNSPQPLAGMPTLQGGQCESCHGPGSQHLGNIRQNRISNSKSAGVCAVCHDTIAYEYSRSDHLLSMSTPQRRVWENKPGCAYCHVTQAYIEVFLNKQKSRAPYKDKTAITCITCHDSHGNAGKDSMLRIKKVENACDGCHDRVTENEKDKFMGFPQGLMVKGEGGFTLTGEKIPANPHARVEKNCVGCHMAKTTPNHIGSVGGHTFLVISRDNKENPVLNDKGCIDCHKNITLEFVKNTQEKTRKLIDTLSDILPHKEKKVPHPLLRPKFPKDPSLNEIQARAAFNYMVVIADWSYGLHHPPYIKKLLENSIQAMKNENKKKKPMEKNHQ